MARADVELVTTDLLRAWPLPGLADADDKNDRGSIHVVGGTVATPGAVLLAGLAALRVGAGRLTISTVEETAVALAVEVPEAMVRGLPGQDGSLAECALHRPPDAVVVGPGLSDPGRLVDTVRASCGDAAMVIDAGALRDLPDQLATRTVLTPNGDELERLAGREGDLAELATAVSDQHKAVVCTQEWVAAPGGRLWRLDTGSIALGTSGSGDVLAGIIGGLLARGCEPDQAACWGQYLHGAAAERVKTRTGEVGLLARELLDELPALVEGLRT